MSKAHNGEQSEETVPPYYRVSPRLWDDFRGCSDDTKLLACHILTSRHRITEGLFLLPKAYICEDLEWSEERLAEPFAELLARGFIEYDEEHRLILIVNALKYQRPDTINNVKHALKKIPDEAVRSPLYQRFYARAEQFSKRLAEGLRERFGNGVRNGVANGVRNGVANGVRNGVANPPSPSPSPSQTQTLADPSGPAPSARAGEHKKGSRSRASRPAFNATIDAIVEAFGWDPNQITDSRWGEIQKAAKNLAGLSPPATADEIRLRLRRFKKRMPGITHTPSGLVKFWPDLGLEDDGPRFNPITPGVHRDPASGRRVNLEA